MNLIKRIDARLAALHLLSEIQYKETSTNIDRANSPGVRLQGSINDLYHKRPKAKKSPKIAPVSGS